MISEEAIVKKENEALGFGLGIIYLTTKET